MIAHYVPQCRPPQNGHALHGNDLFVLLLCYSLLFRFVLGYVGLACDVALSGQMRCHRTLCLVCHRLSTCQAPHHWLVQQVQALLKRFIRKLRHACRHRHCAILCSNTTLAQTTLPLLFGTRGIGASDSNSTLAIIVSKRRGNCNSYTGKLNTTGQRVDGTSKQAQTYNASPLW